MDNTVTFEINKETFNLKLGEFYLIETSIESIEGLLVLNSNLEKEKTVIINSFSKYMNTILVTQYFEKNKKMLKKQGLNYDLGFSNSNSFKILISNEKDKYSTIFINTMGLSYESIEKLSLFLIDLVNLDNKTVFLVNYNSNNKEYLKVLNYRSETLIQLYEILKN